MNEVDLYNQLQNASFELVQCVAIKERKTKIAGLTFSKITVRDLVQFFIHMEQMQNAGVSLLDSLADIRDSVDNDMMRDVVGEIYRDVRDGLSLSEAMAKHPKVFKPLYLSLIKAGEDTGNLTAAYSQLQDYLKRLDTMQSKVKKATRYPMVVTVVVLCVIVFMMSVVVPQIVGFLKYLDIELPWFTVWLIATSNFFIQPQFSILGIPVYGVVLVFLFPIIFLSLFFSARRMSSEVTYQIDSLYLRLPTIGPLIRKVTIARYAQTFSALFSSGIDVIQSLAAARGTVGNTVLLAAMESVETSVKSGKTLSAAMGDSGEFPGMVVRMTRIGEESGQLSTVLDQVAEFYTKDVDEAIDALIEMIQPTLTIVLALVITWIAAGSLGPVYINLGNMMDF